MAQSLRHVFRLMRPARYAKCFSGIGTARSPAVPHSAVRLRIVAGDGSNYPVGSVMAGLGLTSLLLGVPAQTKCEEAGNTDIKLATYNVLSPPLGRPSQFPSCQVADCDPENRLPKIMTRLEVAAAENTVIALQEVDLEWAGKLHAFFAERDYCVVFGQYGSAFSNYMGVMIAWPRQTYETLSVDISRISDTAPKGTWPKAKKNTPQMYGTFTKDELRDVLGFYPPAVSPASFDEWKNSQERKNEAIFVRLRRRGADGRSFVVSTYHMPCLFGSAPKVRVMNIHVYLLLAKLGAFANGDPAVLMGDFNIKPADAAYGLIAHGGELQKAAGLCPDEFTGLGDRLPSGPALPGGLESAYRVFHGAEPLFTNFAMNPGHSEPFCECLDYIWLTPGAFAVTECPSLPKSQVEVAGSFPNSQEPSDHLPLHASIKLKT